MQTTKSLEDNRFLRNQKKTVNWSRTEIPAFRLLHSRIAARPSRSVAKARVGVAVHHAWRSEEHTSELQSLAYLVCRLLLEKKKTARLPSKLHIRYYTTTLSRGGDCCTVPNAMQQSSTIISIRTSLRTSRR